MRRIILAAMVTASVVLGIVPPTQAIAPAAVSVGDCTVSSNREEASCRGPLITGLEKYPQLTYVLLHAVPADLSVLKGLGKLSWLEIGDMGKTIDSSKTAGPRISRKLVDQIAGSSIRTLMTTGNLDTLAPLAKARNLREIIVPMTDFSQGGAELARRVAPTKVVSFSVKATPAGNLSSLSKWTSLATLSVYFSFPLQRVKVGATIANPKMTWVNGKTFTFSKGTEKPIAGSRYVVSGPNRFKVTGTGILTGAKKMYESNPASSQSWGLVNNNAFLGVTPIKITGLKTTPAAKTKMQPGQRISASKPSFSTSATVTAKYKIGMSCKWLKAGKVIQSKGCSYPVKLSDSKTNIELRVTSTVNAAGYKALDPTTVSRTFNFTVGGTAKPKATILGTPKVGSRLTAKVTGTAPGKNTASYQWLRNGKAIKGATKTVYVPGIGDAGKRLSVIYKATNPRYRITNATSTRTTPVAVNLRASVAGTVKVGSRLAAKVSGAVTGSRISFHWLRNDKAITGATKSTYKLAGVDAGKRLSVRATAKKAGIPTATTTSAKTAKVAKGTLSTTKAPAITGTVAVGKTLKAKTGTWRAKPTSFTYQWQANGKNITKATGASYKISQSNKGKKITLKLTAHKAGYSSKTVLIRTK